MLALAVNLVQVQAALILLLGWLGWSWSAHMRRQERLRIARCSVNTTFKSNAAQQGGCWPGVTVVVPVKGCRPTSEHNWATQLASTYAGPLEFLFVLDSQHDAAYGPIQRLLAQHPSVSGRSILAPAADSCSQKIANLLAGVEAAAIAHRYVLMVDDDVALHESSIARLVDELEAHPGLFMATGYPFDLPPPGASFLTYAMLAYHLPLIIAFSVRQRTAFVWGGCMLLRLEELRTDEHGVLQAWRNGGYSDDMLLAAKCSEAKLAIAAPSHALFAQWLPQYVSLSAYWNYLRRQLVVLDTYSSEHNRRLNHTMMIVHAWTSAMLALGCVAALVQLFLGSRSVACERYTLGCACSLDKNECSSSGGNLHASWSLWLLLASVALAQLGMYLNAQQSLLLLHALSPHMAHGSMAAGMHLFSWLHVWGGLLFESLVLPPCMLWTYCHSDIEWSGLRYRKCNGRVRSLVATNNCTKAAQ